MNQVKKKARLTDNSRRRPAGRPAWAKLCLEAVLVMSVRPGKRERSRQAEYEARCSVADAIGERYRENVSMRAGGRRRRDTSHRFLRIHSGDVDLAGPLHARLAADDPRVIARRTREWEREQRLNAADIA